MTPIARIARVLVGMDFDEASAAALRLATTLARAWQAEVTIFHAEPDDVPAYFTTKQIAEIEIEQQQSRAAIAEKLRVFAAPHTAGASVLVGSSPPQDAILRMAPQFDLVVLGTHRRHGAQRWWLGSVAEAVVAESPRPVLVVPNNARGPFAARAPNILSAGDAIPAVDAWIATLRTAFGGRVIGATSPEDCSADHLRGVDLIVFPLAAGARHAHVKAVAHLLKECVHPVLFVPHAREPVERS